MVLKQAERHEKASANYPDGQNLEEASAKNAKITGIQPRIGEAAPHFTADSTGGVINFPEDYAGKWVVLFSHCADFTPVCTSECMVFANLDKEFDRYNCAIIGVSPGSVERHLRWVENIEKTIQYRGLKNVKINFPLIDDQSMDVARLYGMMPAATDVNARFPVRAVFFIDPRGIIRATCYYPRAVGRSFDEIKRVMLALQTSDSFDVMTPADWKIGDDIIIPPAVLEKIREQESNITSDPGYQDWYFYSKPLAKERIIARIFKKTKN